MGTVVIVGGTGGIGSATARRLARGGTRVHLVARDASRLETLARELDAGWTSADVTDTDALTRAIADAATAAGGTLAGLAYAVGTIQLKPLARITAAEFEHDFRVNALGAALAVQAALPALKAHEASSSVLLFSSVAVAQGFAAHASIGMAKGAIEGLTRSLAAELAPKIRVNCIAPSLTRTELAASLTSNESMAKAIAQLHALQRLGEPDDIAPLAALLLSSEGSWISGQILGVDGGRATLRTKG